MILYGSVSSKGKSPLCSPLINPPAKAKLSKRPLSSHCLNADGIETVRFISIRGAQKRSVRWTFVKETSRIVLSADCCALQTTATVVASTDKNSFDDIGIKFII